MTHPIRAKVEGLCDPAFEPVRRVFAESFDVHDELGAAVSVWLDGRVVVDLFGGFVDPERTRPWRRDTLVNVYSVGKGVLATLALILVERGWVDLDRPVASIWSGFEVCGKQDVTLRMLLAHRAGLPAVRTPLPKDAMLDWDTMCAALAAERPYWAPDTAHGYHVNTFGFLVGEVLRRATGQTVPDLLHEWISAPLGVDFYFGLPHRLHDRVARMSGSDRTLERREQWAEILQRETPSATP